MHGRPGGVQSALARRIGERIGAARFRARHQRIEHISAHTEPSEWRATTDRGDTRFTLNSEDDIRTLSEHRVLITDANGMRYVIADVRALDAVSRRRLEHYI